MAAIIKIIIKNKIEGDEKSGKIKVLNIIFIFIDNDSEVNIINNKEIYNKENFARLEYRIYILETDNTELGKLLYII